MPTANTQPAPVEAAWRAGNDRVAHAHRAFRRCMVCCAALEQIPEAELRLLDGNR